ncbi:MAG: hypothetical protein HQL13_00950 [Candidatus Omnitrophica bacterium]|nr:hypothetical protein [Candidatus Omnitrophota bacterium]
MFILWKAGIGEYFSANPVIAAQMQVGSRVVTRYNQAAAQEIVYNQNNLAIDHDISRDINHLLLKTFDEIQSPEARLFFNADKMLGYVEDFVLAYKLMYKDKRLVESFEGMEEFVNFVFGDDGLLKIQQLRIEDFDDFVINATERLMEKVMNPGDLSIQQQYVARLNGYRDKSGSVLFPKVDEIVDVSKRIKPVFNKAKEVLLSQETGEDTGEKEMNVVKRLLMMDEDDVIRLAGFDKNQLKIELEWSQDFAMNISDIGKARHLEENFVPGGIDLKVKKAGLDIERVGQGVKIKFNPAMIAEFQRGKFSGVVANIIRIIPLLSILPILGLQTS